MMTAPLWTPTPERISEATPTRFLTFASDRAGDAIIDTPALHSWSIADPDPFWNSIWDFFGVVGDKGARQLIDGDLMPGARFFQTRR